MSFREFLGINIHSILPDDSTLWKFCGHLKNAGLDEVLRSLTTSRQKQPQKD
ncbi:MAG: hypothetical protein LBT46_04150 [Planctomycetaceae bacterium]|nr:hypothetical protein [Planctomycetaceae bacterium]